MSKSILVCIVALALVVSARPSYTAEPSQDDAVAAAMAWLVIVDAGKYEDSWDQSGASFRQALTKQQWKQAVASARDPLGIAKSRELKTKNETTALPNAPPGRYVVFQFNTSFAHKDSAAETVVTVLEDDSQWRVVGYFVK